MRGEYTLCNLPGAGIDAVLPMLPMVAILSIFTVPIGFSVVVRNVWKFFNVQEKTTKK